MIRLPLFIICLLTGLSLAGQSIDLPSPTSGIQFIAPPEVNNQGSVQLEFPLNLPPGRQGMEPELQITYSSESQNGWLGLGWNLSVPTIEIDTRWGVPRYSASHETETYLYNGEQLHPLAHRGALRERNTDQRFYPRVEGSFDRIIRHGDQPGNYWWEVTATDGTRFFYGGTAEDGFLASACLTTNAGRISRWALVEVRDINDNFVRYHYQTVTDNGLAVSNEVGRQLYPQSITYTGHGSTEGAFRIEFMRDRELGEARRVDVQIDANLGFKQVTADLLRRVTVSYQNQLVRAYRLDYQTGAFNKTLLTSITEEGADGSDFYTHTLDYYDDVRQEGTYQPFQAAQNWSISDDNIIGPILNPIDAMNGETSAIGGSSSDNFSVGGAATVGFNDFNLLSKDKTAGGTYAYANSNDEGLVALVDLNGDGLADKVYRKGNALKYRPNLGIAGTGNTSFGAERPVNGIQQFSTSRTTSNSWGFEGNPPFSYVGFEYTNATTTSDTYFSDFNGDGLLDIAQQGRVWFNHLNANGDPTFTTSSDDTPSPIIPAGELDGDLVSIDPDELEERIDQYPLHDVVRMWQSPFFGVISIDAPVRLIPGAGPQASSYGQQDGVRVVIQKDGTEYWDATIPGDDFSTYQPDNVGAIQVNAGDRIYFRVQSIFDGAYDQVEWSPEIRYTSIPEERLDVNDLDLARYQAEEDFLISAEQQVGLPLDGDLRIVGNFSKEKTSDDIVVIIYKFGDLTPTLLYQETFPGDSIVNQAIEVDFSGQEQEEVHFLIRAKTQIDWQAINWIPNMFYTASPDAAVFDGEGNPLFSFCPAVAYQMFNKVWDTTAPFTVTDTASYQITPILTFDNNPEEEREITFSIKKEGCLLDKVTFNYNSYDTVQPLVVDLLAGDSIWVEYHVNDYATASLIANAQFEWFVDSTSMSMEPLDAGLFSLIREEDQIFGHLYRGWGQFVYNGNRDRALEPINEVDLTVDEEVEDPPEDIPDDPDQLDGFYNPTEALFLIMLADAKTQSWLGYDELTYLNATTVSSSRLGDDNIAPQLPSPSGGGLGAPNRITKTNEYSVAGGLGFSVVTGTASQTWTDSEVTLDVMDFNGDRYPDIISTDRIQYTNDRGGLEGQAVLHGFEGHHKASSTATGFTLGGSFVSSRTSNSGEPKGGASNRRSAKAKRRSSKLGKTSKNAGNTASESIGISGTFSSDGDAALHSWADINGDGLVDKVFDDGRAALNYGYSFGTPEQWGFPGISAGESTDYGGGFGINLFNGSIAGGISLTRTDNFTTEALEDVNADGLPDIVIVGDPVKVRLNTGTGFGPTINWLGIDQFDEGSATGESVNTAFTVCIPIVFIGIKICFNPSSSFGHGVSRQKKQLGDINGDGFPDFLSSEHDGNLTILPSNIGRTNLLRSVQRPLGGSFTVDYQPNGTTYDLPYVIWTMTSLDIRDGVPEDGGDRTASRFAYGNGKHDRHERSFYGFEWIEETELDTDNQDTPYRVHRFEFDQNNYYSQGLLLAEQLLDADGNLWRSTEFTYEFRDVETGAALIPVQLGSDNFRAFPALRNQRDQFYFGEAEPAITHTMLYDYDLNGQLIEWTDLGAGGAEERVDIYLQYHDLEEPYVKSQWREITVEDQSGILRQRESVLDASAALTQLKETIAPGQTATYDFEYDAYGNMTRMIRPANAAGQRQFYAYTFDEGLHTYPTSRVDAFGLSEQYEHDPIYGTQLTYTDANNAIRTQQIDDFGRLTQVTEALDAAAGHPYSLQFSYHPTAAIPYVHLKRYDPEHETDWEQYDFIDGFQQLIQQQELGEITEQGTVSPSLQFIISGREFVDPFGRTTSTYYPSTMGVTSGGQFQADPDAISPTQIEYDVLDRPTQIELPDGGTYTIRYGVEQAPQGILCHATTITDPLGGEQRILEDAQGRQRATMEAGAIGPVWTQWQYNGVGELVAIIDHQDNATRYTYDGLGRQTEIDHPDGGLISYLFDASGNILEKVTPSIRANAPDGGAIEYTYDFDRLLQIDYPFNPQNQVRYHYGDLEEVDSNRVGRVWLVEDGSGAQEYVYDESGQVVKTVRTMLLNEVLIPTFVTRYAYDSWGRLQELTYPDGEVATYAYNRGGRVKSLAGEKQGFSYEYVEECRYDKFGQRSYITYGNGTENSFGIDPTNRRIIESRVNLPQAGTLSRRSYVYDLLGNLTSVNEQQTASAETGARQLTQSYAYDELYRLTEAAGQWQSPTETRSYELAMEVDELYNPLVQSMTFITETAQASDTLNSSRIYEYADERPHFPTRIGEHEHTPTADGRPEGWLVGEDYRLYLWDEEGRLAAMSDNGYVSRYSYDAEGRRAIRSHGPTQGLYLDAVPLGVINHGANDYTLYVNPFLSATREGFTKHYFLEDEVIASKAGTGYFADQLLPPSQTITAGGLDLSERVRLLREMLMGYLEDLAIPPGHPTLPGYHAEPGQPLPTLEGSSQPQFSPPPGWPRPQGQPDPNGPPGHPIWYAEPATSDNAEPGYGYYSTPAVQELEQYFYHADPLQNVVHTTNVFGEVLQQRAYLPFGMPLADEGLLEATSPRAFRLINQDEESGLYYFGDRYYLNEDALWLDILTEQNPTPHRSPYYWGNGNPLPGVDRQLITNWIAQNGVRLSAPTNRILTFGVDATGEVAVGGFDLQGAGSAPPVSVPAENQKRKKKQNGSDDEADTIAGNEDSAGGLQKNATTKKGQKRGGVVNNQSLLALRRQFRTRKVNPQPKTEQEQLAEQKQKNRRFVIRPGDWDGIQTPANRYFTFRPDGTTATVRKRGRQKNYLKVRFRVDRM